ncbi:hypothetical protein D7V94_16055 [Parablautia intestinalis]|jgi:hypothetical protein|uniref:Uncharacterized protein n=1 Tax=Parablautia intestinalis TaxID=2320100 RepID=A0A3A9AQV5_9FIRM|nr:DUF5692 family protein [Parablautia intestinalis]MCI8614647.1 hypothetical protein [Lachnospiraceae bacterium]RKI89913.1 hypothetical protein D7V94_16055 [Parablautia intestinalis]
MIFQIYSGTTGWQLLGWVMVFGGLILVNEIARRTKAGGMACFFALPAVLTVYFISIYVGAARGAEWALNNQTYVHMNSWFHYAKLYAALAGCIGFMVLKYHWGKLGKSHGFKVFPFVIVAINILIAVVSDFESVVRAGSIAGGWWKSSEGVWLYGGWWNILNGIAGILNILCMTGWWGIYSSKDKKDMLWPDMTWCFILAYDIWNFQYTYLNLPTHSWYCGFALLLAPTVANALWNKGGWIQNRANTLALWCMFAQVFPLFQDASRFTTVSSVYGAGGAAAAFGEAMPTTANPAAQGIISVISIVVNLAVFLVILKRAKQQNKNPYTNEIFTDQKDFKLAMDRAE